MERQRVRVVVSGRVQGVFFRDSTRQVARRSGVTGWVRNRDDGRVEAEVQGPPEAVQAVVEFCHDGPARAQVVDVDVTDIDVRPDEQGFAVR